MGMKGICWPAKTDLHNVGRISRRRRRRVQMETALSRLLYRTVFHDLHRSPL